MRKAPLAPAERSNFNAPIFKLKTFSDMKEYEKQHFFPLFSGAFGAGIFHPRRLVVLWALLAGLPVLLRAQDGGGGDSLQALALHPTPVGDLL